MPVRLELVDEGPVNARYLVHLDDGARVEAVRYRAHTLCLSSQVGCAVGCPFCASGANGLARPLTEGELRFQVEAVEEAGGIPLERLTLSGVGEPLHAHGATRPFLDWARSRGLPTSLTTSGGPTPRLREWLHAPHNGLTLSCHAGTEATRAALVPRGPSLADLFATLGDELPSMTRKRRKKTALAYLLLAGANDGKGDIDGFLDRAVPLGLRVHLYGYNPVPTSDHRGPDPERFDAIEDHMRQRGARVVRSSKARRRANGGCGTLIAIRRRQPPS